MSQPPVFDFYLPASHLLTIPTPQTTSSMSAICISRLPVSLHRQHQTRTRILASFSPRSTALSHCPSRTHNQSACHPPAHNAHSTNNIQRVSHFASHRLLQPPATRKQAHSPLPHQNLHLPGHCSTDIHKKCTSCTAAHSTHVTNNIIQVGHFASHLLLPPSVATPHAHSSLYLQTLRLVSHSRKSSHRQPTNYTPAHTTNISGNIKSVSYSASHHLLPTPVAVTRDPSPRPLQTLHRISRCCNPISVRPTSHPICPRHRSHNQDQSRQSLRTAQPPFIAIVKLTC